MFLDKIKSRINEIEKIYNLNIENIQRRLNILENKPEIDLSPTKNEIERKISNLAEELNNAEESFLAKIEYFNKEINILTTQDKETGYIISAIEAKLNQRCGFLDEKIDRLEKSILEINNKLSGISEQYCQTVEKILNFNKEMFIKDIFLHNIKDTEFVNFRTKLVQPILEAKWEKEKQETGQKIESAGVDILNRRNELNNEMLIKEREGENIDKIKIQLEVYDEIIRKVQK